MENYSKLEKIEICFEIDKKECKKDFKREFIENIQLKYFDIFKNPTIKSEVEEKEIKYHITAENGYFIIFEDVPLHMHIDYYFKNEKEIEKISNLISRLGELCEKVSKQEVKSIPFIIRFNFSLLNKIKIENTFGLKEKDKFTEENNIKKIMIKGIEFIITDFEKYSYNVNISNTQKKLSLVIIGRLHSKKEKERLKLHELYTILKKKVESLLIFINGDN